MKIETKTDSEGNTDSHFIAEPGEHLIYTGKVQGLKTLADGSVVDLSPDYVAVPISDLDKRAEIHDLVGQHWVDNGHPDDVEHLEHPETGERVPVQRPFVHVTDAGEIRVGVGHPHGEHPFDEHNGVVPAMADPRIAEARKQKG